jgi:eukaryotic-like serine/threonine-protein kinase
MPSAPDVIERLRSGLSGRYVVERELGRGGMAIVFLARDLRHGRMVAIKVLPPDLATSLSAERFLQEIRTTAQIVHPHVLPVHDSGEVDGLLYYIMPFVAGESLATRIERAGPLPVREAVRIAREIADGLVHAHRLGIVHRDIKPANILLSGSDHACIADFGLARAFFAAASTRLTSTGVTVGSPHYISPEQISGGEGITGRTDVYGLGCMLFEMLVGRPPFEGSTVQAVLTRQLTETPARLSDLGVPAPAELEDAVLRAMRKDPADRPDASQFGKLLDRLYQNLPDVAGQDGMHSALREEALPHPSPGRPWLRDLRPRSRGIGAHPAEHGRLGTRSRVVAVALAILISAGIGLGMSGRWGGFGSLGRVGPGNSLAASGFSPTHIAVLYFDDHSPGRELGYLADGLTEALIHELSQVEALEVVSRNGVKPYRGASVPLDSIVRTLQVGSIVEGSVTQAGETVRVTVQLIDGGSGMHVHSRVLEHPVGDLLSLQDDVVQQVAQALRSKLGPQVRLRQARRGTSNARAWELVLRAKSLREDYRTLRATDADAGRRALLRADSTLAEAERLDGLWWHASVVRGWIARDLAVLEGPLPGLYRDDWARRALEHADRALRLRPDDPEAFELRGVLRQEYAKSVKGAERRAMLQAAEADLRQAVELDGQRARAWWGLSELLLEQARFAEAKLAAERALRADAFLEDAASVVHQIYKASLQLGPEEDAIRQCDYGRRRFPKESNFIVCQLFILASFPQVEPDVERAWALADSLDALIFEHSKEPFRAFARMLVAQVAARAGLADSTHAIIHLARGDRPTPAWLAYNEAHARLLLGERDTAVDLLSRFLQVQPDTALLARDWWFRDLRSDPRFQALVGLGP